MSRSIASCNFIFGPIFIILQFFAASMYGTSFVLPAQDVSIGRRRHVCSQPFVRLDVPRRRRRHRRVYAFSYITYPIFVQCYVMGRFVCWLGPFWSCFFLQLGPFWRWAVLVGSPSSSPRLPTSPHFPSGGGGGCSVI